MKQIEARVLYRPPSAAQRFLPEGPYRCDADQLSWVAIQHGLDERVGSLNVLDLNRRTNRQFLLDGRPGFALPTTRSGTFLIGLERSVVLFDCQSGRYEPWVESIDIDVENTIINDGIVYEGHLIFGCKDLEFSHNKAGLYLVKAGTRTAIRLRDDQICSNGKAIAAAADGRLTLYDIDSPSQQVVAWKLDLELGQLSDPQVIVDLTSSGVFPDGMILTPDERGLIVALYDPRDSDHGEARCYDLESGECQTVWRCATSPRVTCPQLVRLGDAIQLVLTTADEGMSPELRDRSPHAGSLFVADTEFNQLNDNPSFSLA